MRVVSAALSARLQALLPRDVGLSSKDGREAALLVLYRECDLRRVNLKESRSLESTFAESARDGAPARCGRYAAASTLPLLIGL
jgi:hypothetical protein